VWSVASGKHVLFLNNMLVFQTPPSSAIKVIPTQRFEHSLNVPESVLPGGHVIHIAAWALGIGSHASLEKQFIIHFDGQSYQHFCPIYVLGSSRMMRKYEIALKKAREKMHRFAQAHGDSDLLSHNRSSDPPGVMLGDRPRRNINQEQNGSNNQRYWDRPTMQHPPRADMDMGYRQRRPSAPEMLPSDLLSGDVAKSDEEEDIMIAKARINSFRDMREYQDKSQSGIYANNQQEQENFVARAKIHSFRDMRAADDMTIPSFARPPPSTRPQPSHVQNRPHLQSVQEGIDLLDVNNTLHPGRGLVRSSSNVTLDTAIKTPEDDLMSLASGYSHLDPNQNWKTQQNISFRLQRPPVYADTAAGDLIQPSPSFSNQSFHGNASVQGGYGLGSQGAPPLQPMHFAGRHMSYNQQQQQQSPQWQHQQQQQQSPQWQQSPRYQVPYATPPSQQTFSPSMGPQMSSNMSFTAAPQPTFETLNAAFAPSANYAAPQPTFETLNAAFAPSSNYAGS
jgi:hypothetical protein